MRHNFSVQTHDAVVLDNFHSFKLCFDAES